MIEKQIIVNNLLTNYYVVESKAPAARTVIFLHGWRANGMIWMPVVKLLTQRFFSAEAVPNDSRSYNIYCPDLAGFGKSEKYGGLDQGPDETKVDNYVETVKKFILKLNLSAAALIGHSFGGRVAIKLAALYPQSLAKLVLVDSAGIVTASVGTKLLSATAKVLKPLIPLRLRNKAAYLLGAKDYVETPAELKKTFRNVIREDLRSLLPQIKSPTLIIWGRKDTEIPLKFGQLMNSLIPYSKFLILNNAGHFSFLDDPEGFVKELKNFLSEHESFQAY